MTVKFLFQSYRSIMLSLVGFCLLIGVLGCSPATEAPNSQTDDLDAKILQVIRDNPGAIIESVQAYQQQQQVERQQASQKVLDQLQENPTSIIGDSPTTGSAEQSIVLVEFSDFQCPFCARAHDTLKQFMDAYGQDVTLVYKHLPLIEIHPQAVPAAQASWAADQQGKFWEFHDVLFENSQRLSDDFYVEAATELGLDIDKFNDDRASEAAVAAVKADQELANQLGLTGTPAFFMNGIPINGAQPLDKFKEVLAQAKANL